MPFSENWTPWKDQFFQGECEVTKDHKMGFGGILETSKQGHGLFSFEVFSSPQNAASFSFASAVSYSGCSPPSALPSNTPATPLLPVLKEKPPALFMLRCLLPSL